MNDLKTRNNIVELTEPLVRDGVEYPSGTRGYLYGAMAETDKTVSLMMRIGDIDVFIGNNAEVHKQFHYKHINEK